MVPISSHPHTTHTLTTHTPHKTHPHATHTLTQHTPSHTHPHNTHSHATHTLTQVTRFDHENLAKMYDQVCAKVRMLQHDKDKLQDLEGRYLDELKRCVCGHYVT